MQQIKAQQEDLLFDLSTQPARAAGAIAELFNDVVWNHEQLEVGESELTPEEKAKAKQEWDTEMAAFWKRLDRLVGEIVNHPDRPEFDPGEASASCPCQDGFARARPGS